MDLKKQVNTLSDASHKELSTYQQIVVELESKLEELKEGTIGVFNSEHMRMLQKENEMLQQQLNGAKKELQTLKSDNRRLKSQMIGKAMGPKKTKDTSTCNHSTFYAS